jgi:hypothetical protein
MVSEIVKYARENLLNQKIRYLNYLILFLCAILYIIFSKVNKSEYLILGILSIYIILTSVGRFYIIYNYIKIKDTYDNKFKHIKFSGFMSEYLKNNVDMYTHRINVNKLNKFINDNNMKNKENLNLIIDYVKSKYRDNENLNIMTIMVSLIASIISVVKLPNITNYYEQIQIIISTMIGIGLGMWIVVSLMRSIWYVVNEKSIENSIYKELYEILIDISIEENR